MNGAWALSVVVSPIAAGALLGPLGSKGTFGVSELLCFVALAVGWYALRTRPRRRASIGTADRLEPAVAVAA